MRPNDKTPGYSSGSFLGDFLSFDRIIAGEVLKLVYWAGLGVVAIFAFAAVGGSIGVAFNDGPRGMLLAIPGIIVGLLIAAALGLLWRAFCEFFAAILRIAEDLHALRLAQEAEKDPFGR